MDIYGFLIGSWELDIVGYDEEKNVIHSIGEAHFAWVLEGRAVQDVFINPRRTDRGPDSPKFANWFGTTIRIYDPTIQAWRVNWWHTIEQYTIHGPYRWTGKGFGVNLALAPGIPGRETAALSEAMLPQAFAPLLAGSFARMLTLWRTSEPEAFARAWLARAHPIGTQLTVHGGTREVVTGAFDGIEPDGALRLRRGADVEIIRAGDVEL